MRPQLEPMAASERDFYRSLADYLRTYWSNVVTPRTAYRLDYLTRQQFIDMQWKIAEAKQRFKERYPSAFFEGGPTPATTLDSNGTGLTSEGRSFSENANGSSNR